MTRDQQRVISYLAHNLEAIERIQRYTDGMDGPAFLNSALVQDAVVRNFANAHFPTRPQPARTPDLVEIACLHVFVRNYAVRIIMRSA